MCFQISQCLCFLPSVPVAVNCLDNLSSYCEATSNPWATGILLGVGEGQWEATL